MDGMYVIKQVLAIITMSMAYGSLKLWWSIEVERIGKMESEECGTAKWHHQSC